MAYSGGLGSYGPARTRGLGLVVRALSYGPAPTRVLGSYGLDLVLWSGSYERVWFLWSGLCLMVRPLRGCWGLMV